MVRIDKFASFVTELRATLKFGDLSMSTAEVNLFAVVIAGSDLSDGASDDVRRVLPVIVEVRYNRNGSI
jgi:hypothetical protein